MQTIAQISLAVCLVTGIFSLFTKDAVGCFLAAAGMLLAVVALS